MVRPLLMIPGPVDIDDAVLEAYGSPMTPHYGPAFVKLYNETADYLKRVLGTKGDAFLMTGPGTIALEAAIASLVGVGEKAIIVNNGFFGDRLVQFTKAFGGNVIEVPAEWGKPVDPADFIKAVKQHPDTALAMVVHFETSTGVTNPVREIGAAMKGSGVPYMVDAVSSIGGVPYEMDPWNIDVTVTAPQKCLGVPPGLGLIALNPSLWPRIEKRASQPHGWYLNLNTWRHYAKIWADWHPQPTTMPPNNVMALHEGLRQLLEEGLGNRIARFQRLADHLRAGLKELGMGLVVPAEIASAVMTVVWGPPGVPTSQVVRFVDAEHGIKIANGLGNFRDKVIRIGHMSPRLTIADMDQLLKALGDFIQRQNK